MCTNGLLSDTDCVFAPCRRSGLFFVGPTFDTVCSINRATVRESMSGSVITILIGDYTFLTVAAFHDTPLFAIWYGNSQVRTPAEDNESISLSLKPPTRSAAIASALRIIFSLLPGTKNADRKLLTAKLRTMRRRAGLRPHEHRYLPAQ